MRIRIIHGVIRKGQKSPRLHSVCAHQVQMKQLSLPHPTPPNPPSGARPVAHWLDFPKDYILIPSSIATFEVDNFLLDSPAFFRRVGPIVGSVSEVVDVCINRSTTQKRCAFYAQSVFDGKRLIQLWLSARVNLFRVCVCLTKRS